MKWSRHLAGLPCLLLALAATAQSSRPVAVIGGADDRAAVLDNPRDLAVLGNRIVVLDAGQPFLKVFDLNGRLIQRFVRSGSGPGEIAAARRLAIDSAARRVYTLDVMNLRANVYRLDDSLVFERSFRTPAPMEDACFYDGRLFLLGMFGGKLVHEVDPRGSDARIVRSFGVARANHELDTHPTFQSQVAKGRLACSPGGGTIVAVSAYTGVAQVFNAQSGAQRTVRLDSLVPLTFAPTEFRGGVGVMQYAPNNTFHIVHRAAPTRDGIRILADYLGPDHEGNEDFEAVHELVLAPNGTLRPGMRTRQREVGRSGDLVACFVGSPIPTIEIHRATRCP